VNDYRLRQWVRGRARRVGFDIVRHPTPRDPEGHLRLLLGELGIDHVLDVGANVGQYGRMLRSIGYTGKITSFEPVGTAFAALQTTINGDDKWDAVNIALGAEPGYATIHVTHSQVYASMLLPTTAQPGSPSDIDYDEKVSIHRLDEVYADTVDVGASVLLKLDTQGFDLFVLKGATGCLDNVLAIQTEISVVPLYEGMPTWIESMSRLAELGFEPTGLFPVTYADTFRSVEFDLVTARTTPR